MRFPVAVLSVPARLPSPAPLLGILQRLGESLEASTSRGEVRQAGSWRRGGFGLQ